MDQVLKKSRESLITDIEMEEVLLERKSNSLFVE